MALSGEEIRRRLTDFAAKWSVYAGSERAEAQTYLNELFACYGTDRSDVARFEDPQHGRFLDLVWDRVCIIEMKRPSEASRLSEHRAQAFDYWRGSADPRSNRPAPRFVVLCAFRRFEVWEPGAYPAAPRADFDIVELPDRLDALLFLAGGHREPVFLETQEAVTRVAVSHVTGLYQRLLERRAAPSDVLRDFVLQSVWSMFAEDLGQLDGHLFTRIIEDLIATPSRSSADDLGGLFTWLNTPGDRPTGGLYADTRYVNGGLFETPARVHLEVAELEELRRACDFDWKRVEPHIFGSLLEGALGRESQWALGAHYTHEVDIHKVVGPTIVEPWRERIENATTIGQARGLQEELLNYVVLDPACGSGNFLYISYRELRRLEKRLHDRERDLRRTAGLREQGSLSAFFPLQNIRGIEINQFAVALARVTLWMAHKLAVDELDITEATLPLEDLSGIQVGDALRVPWPRSSVIIGNPPYHGTKHMRAELGDAYLDFLRREYRVGVKDHCVYWVRRAQDHLDAGQRAGMVATNSIAEGKNREASLDYIVANDGVITNAVRTQVWPGVANVHVSIVNWVKAPETLPSRCVLDGKEVSGITSELRPGVARADPRPLAVNRRKQFFGVVPGGKGFVLDDNEARELLGRDDADYAEVVRPYLVGDDITTNPALGPTRWVITFGEMALEEAERWPAALALVRERVKPMRDRHKKARERTQWWKHSRTVHELFEAVGPLPRFIACPATSKRIAMIWCEPHWCPSNATSVFALDDDYAFGVLSSAVHTRWAVARSTRLKSDPRYTVNSFATFPWPTAPSPAARTEIGRLARILDAQRRTICSEHVIGLNALYNAVEEGAYATLSDLHRELDRAVAAAYGWPPEVASNPDEQEQRLLALNMELSAADVGAPEGRMIG
jgi:hypothetical protein